MKLQMLILLMVSSVCQAQYSNHQLYQAYLDQDMTVWEAYILSSDWDAATTEEKKRLLNTEYGYAAYVVTFETEKAENILRRYENHLQDCREWLPEAEYLAHTAALCSYKLSLEKKRTIRYATMIYENIKSAIRLEEDNPFVLTMMGNIEYFSPFGNKKKALHYYQQADSLYSVKGEEYHQWNQNALQKNIEQIKNNH